MLNTIPVATQTTSKIRKKYRARPPSSGAYACMKERNATGIKLPAAKLIGIQNFGCVPACTAVTAAAQTAAISVYAVNRRFKRRLGEAFQTRTANMTRRIGTANEAVEIIPLSALTACFSVDGECLRSIVRAICDRKLNAGYCSSLRGARNQHETSTVEIGYLATNG